MTSASEQRQALIDLTTLARRDLFAFWASLQGLSADQTRDALAVVLPEIGVAYGSAAASLAADWYDELRDAADPKGRFGADPVAAPGPARWESLARWGTSPLFGDKPDPAAAFSLVEGGLQRSISDGHRLTVVEATWRDPSTPGWQRKGSGDSCSFCKMLIGRGAVYRSDTVTFKSHDHCNCMATPTWGKTVGKDVDTVAYSASARRQTKADRDRVRDHLAGETKPKGSFGLAAMSKSQVQQQLALTEGLKDSAWRTQQLARLQKRLGEL